MLQTISQAMMTSNKLNFTNVAQDLATKDKLKKHPYFKNQPPLNDTYTKQLERKYRETEQNFQQEAQTIVDGVRLLESGRNENPLL